MDDLLKITKALSDKNRLRILMMLTRRPLCVCELQAILGVTVSTVSKHLSILREAGLVLDEKEGKWVNYKLNTSSPSTIVAQFLLMVPLIISKDDAVKDDMTKVTNVDRNVLCNIEL